MTLSPTLFSIPGLYAYSTESLDPNVSMKYIIITNTWLGCPRWPWSHIRGNKTYIQTSRAFDQFLTIQGCTSFQRVSFMLWLLFLESLFLLLLQQASQRASDPLELLSPFPIPTPQQTDFPIASLTFLRLNSPLLYSRRVWESELTRMSVEVILLCVNMTNDVEKMS